MKDPEGKPIRLKDFVPHDPDIMEDYVDEDKVDGFRLDFFKLGFQIGFFKFVCVHTLFLNKLFFQHGFLKLDCSNSNSSNLIFQIGF